MATVYGWLMTDLYHWSMLVEFLIQTNISIFKKKYRASNLTNIASTIYRYNEPFIWSMFIIILCYYRLNYVRIYKMYVKSSYIKKKLWPVNLIYKQVTKITKKIYPEKDILTNENIFNIITRVLIINVEGTFN